MSDQPKHGGNRFAPGNAGKPKGARHRVTLAVEALLDGEAELLTRKAVERALAGDTVALKLCLDRIAPARKDRSVTFRAPAVRTAEDVPAALGAVFKAVAQGELTTSEASMIAGIVEKFRAAYEIAELDRRVAAIEERDGRR